MAGANEPNRQPEEAAHRVAHVPVRPVSSMAVKAVIASEPIPDYPLYQGKPLTMERVDTEDEWENKGQQRKARARWDRFVVEVNAVTARRNDKLFTLLMSRGVAVDVPPVELWGVDGDLDLREIGWDEMPPGMQKLMYLHHEYGSEGMIELLVRVMEVSGLQAGHVDNVRGLFREALQAANVAMERGA